jgi:Flp pilus assembly protein TadG
MQAFHFVRDRSGVAAIEFAIVGPVLAFMLLGIVSYGGYFWFAHSVQQLANDAARATVSGIDAPERLSLAEHSVSSGLTTYARLSESHMDVDVSESDQAVSVRISYDASREWFWLLGDVAMPSKTIVREAVVRLGGY